jgi:hypothetical protein
MITLEDKIFYDLLPFYRRNASIHIHSAHPPSGKTYIGSLVRIPKITNGRKTRDRYHLDFLLQIGPVLVFQELKGSASELGADIAKLHSILVTYDLEQIKAILARRIPQANILDGLRFMIPSVGYSVQDASLPETLLQMVVRNGSIRVAIGQKIPDHVRMVLDKAFR